MKKRIELSFHVVFAVFLIMTFLCSCGPKKDTLHCMWQTKAGCVVINGMEIVTSPYSLMVLRDSDISIEARPVGETGWRFRHWRFADSNRKSGEWETVIDNPYTFKAGPKRQIVECIFYKPNETGINWAPSGKQFAYASDRDGGSNIFIYDMDSAQSRNLTRDPSVRDMSPIWDSLGEHLLFKSYRDARWHVYISDVRTGISRNVSKAFQSPDARWVSFPCWSPDGKAVIFDRELESRTHEVLIVDTDGDHLIKSIPVESLNRIFSFVWSPLGDTVAFMAQTVISGSNVYLLDVSTGKWNLLTDTPEPESSVTWSPAGQELAFLRSEPKGQVWELYTIEPDGGNERCLTRLKGRINSPNWSYDGSRIAFECNSDLFVIDRTGENLTRVTESPDREIVPKWAPDGKSILYLFDEAVNHGGYEIRSIDLKTRESIRFNT
jgi:Tol biopolymer transport system component